MATILRDKLRVVNESIKDLSIKRDMVEEKIQMQKSFITDLDKKSKDTIKNRENRLIDLLIHCSFSCNSSFI